MSEIVKTMKLHIHVNETEAKSLEELTACYAQALNGNPHKNSRRNGCFGGKRIATVRLFFRKPF